MKTFFPMMRDGRFFALLSGAVVAILICCTGAYAEDSEDDNVADVVVRDQTVGEALKAIQAGRTMNGTILEKAFSDSIQAITDAYKRAEVDRATIQRERDQIEQPNMYEMMSHFETLGVGNYVSDIQEKSLNRATIQYLSANKKIDEEANPFAGGELKATSNLLNMYARYFCIPNSVGNPENCGENAINNGYLAPNLASAIVGDKTWSYDMMKYAVIFVRAFFGATPDKIDASVGSDQRFISSLEFTARTNLRLSTLNRLMSRRTPFSKSDSSNFVGELFRTYEQAGFINNSNPEAVCAEGAGRGPNEEYLCGFMNKDFLASKAVADRVLQSDFYLSPGFLDTIYSPAYPARGSLDRLEITMRAQQLAQDYQFLRDLQMYTALRAVSISNGN
jgi:hypothetical protein